MKAPSGKVTKKEKLETDPDAWDRFKNAVHKIVPPKKAKLKEDKPSG